MPDLNLIVPVSPFRFVALDVETANSDPASICQIGIACVADNGSIDVFSALVDPAQRFSGFNVQLHGIGPDRVIGAPRFPQILSLISPLLEGHLIIQHSTFDSRAITGACRANGLPDPSWRWANSVTIARRAWPAFRGNGGHGLGHLKKALGLDFAHHDAGEDAKAAAMVVLRAEAQTGLSLEELILAQNRSPGRKPRAARPEADGILVQS
ncbi:3'-5' exonuclease [Paracoccus aminophilus]|uniref:3'-5' exonuclease n=1 Tax=Paracoccus aminophilus TaxID=34003 RepID=UPI00040E0C6D|nr:3'-5' exonuclease [Paracoccus aminophilus]